MSKIEAQQILDNCTTHKRYRCPLTNELHDVIQVNASAINDATQHHNKLLHLIRALRYLYPQIKMDKACVKQWQSHCQNEICWHNIVCSSI